MASNLPSSKFGCELVQEWETTWLVAERRLQSVGRTVGYTATGANISPTPGNLPVKRPTTGNTTRKFCARCRRNRRMFRWTGRITRSAQTCALFDITIGNSLRRFTNNSGWLRWCTKKWNIQITDICSIMVSDTIYKKIALIIAVKCGHDKHCV